MNAWIISLVLSSFVTEVSSGDAARRLVVYRNERTLLVQSAFTDGQDLVLKYDRIANEAAYLVPSRSDIRNYAKGTLLHNGTDDYPASGIAGYGYLGGNHGSSSARKLEIPRHGMTQKDNLFQSAKNQEFYIPKLKPLTIDGVSYDFAAAYRMPDVWKINYTCQRSDCIDPDDPPDRFIRVVGNERREYGIALGCSLFAGSTAKQNKAADRPNSYFFWHTKKMYPLFAALLRPMPGASKEMILYRQYFDPNREPDATAFYYHKQVNSWVVHLDFHKTLRDKVVRLPADFAGKTISILEKTPSLTLHTGATVPTGGIRLSVAGNYGYLVLKLD